MRLTHVEHCNVRYRTASYEASYGYGAARGGSLSYQRKKQQTNLQPFRDSDRACST